MTRQASKQVLRLTALHSQATGSACRVAVVFVLLSEWMDGWCAGVGTGMDGWRHHGREVVVVVVVAPTALSAGQSVSGGDESAFFIHSPTCCCMCRVVVVDNDDYIHVLAKTSGHRPASQISV